MVQTLDKHTDLVWNEDDGYYYFQYYYMDGTGNDKISQPYYNYNNAIKDYKSNNINW